MAPERVVRGGIASESTTRGVLRRRREPQDLWPGVVLGVGLGTVGFVAATLGAIWLFQSWMGLGAGFGPVLAFPEPHLQSDPAGELRAYRAEQRAQLEGYAWKDHEGGMVRIPVARAMELIVARGAAAYAPLDPPHWPDPRR